MRLTHNISIYNISIVNHIPKQNVSFNKMMIIRSTHLLHITLLICGLSVQQSKSDSIRNGIIMNGANEKTADGTNNMADGSIDKNTVVVQQQQQSVDNDDDDDYNAVDDVIRKFSINGSSIQQHQRQQIDPDGNTTQFNRYVSKYLAKHTEAIVVQPNNRIDNMDYKFRYSYPNANNMEVVIHLLDINPYANWLFINATSESDSVKQFNLTEYIEPSHLKRILFPNVTEISIHFWFMNSEWSRYLGFLMTIEPVDASLLIGEKSKHLNSSISMPDENLTILIEVMKSKQNNQTWKLFRILLANSTNLYIDATDKKMEKCSEDNVTFVDTLPCQNSWQNAQNCVQIVLSIRLISKSINETNPGTNIYTLSHSELTHMWIEFGRKEFADSGYQEFPVPNTQKLLFIWGTVSAVVVCAFLMILLVIWKMDILRDYHRMYWGGNADDEKQICKQTNVSMYPPIHQIVPTLFPNDLNASHDLTNAIPFECSRPITFDVSDFKRRQSLEETLKPSENVKRKAGDVPFQSDLEFNESKQDRPEDEMYFNRSSSKLP